MNRLPGVHTGEVGCAQSLHLQDTVAGIAVFYPPLMGVTIGIRISRLLNGGGLLITSLHYL